ncbi:MAG: tetratricopeptide repeat protein [Pyrinomonadaceae bacterium]|nr:tetratricopeptide repeat protein [Pyrinomonadaceae bacterium]
MSKAKRRPAFFLRTKLLPPRSVSDYLPRPRLTSRLESNLSSPITLVAAEAGCGKTTLISEFLREQDTETVWYQLDHTDADPFAFLGYLTEGISGIRPGFGESVFSYLEESKDEFLKTPELGVDLLLNEIFEHFEQPFIVVLDDYHHIGTDTIVHRLVDRLLQYSSDILRLIVTTRDIPPLAIMKHRSRSSALVISRDDLLFTNQEVKDLFKESLGVELDEDEIEEYSERTQGWVTALQLVRQVAEQELDIGDDGERIDLHEILQKSEKDIFDYFAEEVLERESEETKEILLDLSLLDSMPLEICSRVFPDKRCASVLPELVQKNVFVTSVGEGESDEEYRMHPLFRDFLLRRLRSEIGREAIAKERLRIAEHFLGSNAWQKALPYLLDAEEFTNAAEVISEKGEELLDQGKITTFNIYTDRIPTESLKKFPRSLLHMAEAKRHQGEFEESKEILSLAVDSLEKEKDKTGQGEAIYSLASLARRQGDIEVAFEYLDRAETFVNQESETFMKCANTRGLCYAAQGDWAKSEQQFRLALELAESFSNDRFMRIAAHNLAIPTGFRGEFSEALRWLRRMFRDESKPLPQEAYGYLNVGRMHLYRGEFEDALQNLTKSLDLCRAYNMKPIRGEILEALGHYYRDTGEYQKAVEHFEGSRKAYDDAGVNRFRQEVEEEYAIYYQKRRDLNKAQALLEKLLEERQKLNYEFGIKRVELGLAEIKLEKGETKGLVKDLQLLLSYHKEHNFNYEEAQNSLLLARVLKNVGKRKEMFLHLQRALDLTARFDYEYWLKTQLQKNPEFFSDEDIMELLPVDLRELEPEPRHAVEVNVPDSGADALPIADLTVKLLGSVEIYRDKTTPFASDAWTTRRARDIFACIASNKNKRVEKDVLIDMFWAEDDLKAIEKNFHPTISHIRKALNSNQSFKQNFIVFRDGSYQLNPDFSYSIDTDIFENAIESARKAERKGDNQSYRKHAEEACSLYRGEFMSGVYDDWAEELRIYYAEQYSRIVSSLAELAFQDEDWQEAQKHARDVLRHDPYREDMHRIVMQALSSSGSVAAVQRHFDTLENLLEKELGVEPAPETVQKYRELTG